MQYKTPQEEARLDYLNRARRHLENAEKMLSLAHSHTADDSDEAINTGAILDDLTEMLADLETVEAPIYVRGIPTHR